MSPPHAQQSRTSVEIGRLGDEWRVVVVEQDAETVVSFDNRDHAESYAAGQSIRLGLKGINRLE